MHYKLDENNKPIPCDIMEYIEWERDGGDVRRVAFDCKHGVTVSTVFLGLDHGHRGGLPILWETMVFGIGFKPCERYTSHEDAVKGHKEMVAKYLKESRNGNAS